VIRSAVLILWLTCTATTHAQPVQRVATLAPFLAELVYAAGAGGKLVGVSAFSDYPREARSLPVIADAGGVNREALLALRVDAVLAWKSGTPGKQIEALRQSGVNVIVVDGDRLDDIPRLLRRIGGLVGPADLAEQAAARFERELGALRAQYGSKTEVSAMLEIWHRPLITISGKHYMSDALLVCGGRNVFADYPGVAPEVSIESVLKANPAAIIGAGSAQDERSFRENWLPFPALYAVKQGHLIYLEADLIQRQTPRILDGVHRLCVALEGVRSSRQPARSR
jgi:iron complex transport system substrate-binding protein